MERRIRMGAMRATGLNTNSIARTPGLAGGRTMWHARFNQFPYLHTLYGLQGPLDRGRPLLVAGMAFAAGWLLCSASKRR